MAHALAKRSPTLGDDDYDDGFSDSSSGRQWRGSYLKWNEQEHWLDRDGVTPPSPMLVYGIGESVRRWRTDAEGKRYPEDITTKPLPDAEELNGTTPRSEWERQRDGSRSAGWAHTVFVHLVNLVTGEKYSFAANTVGAHIAYDSLKEAVTTMRLLRGTKCFAVVKLEERPMKSKHRPGGMGVRPHFEIVDWKVPGDPNVVGGQSTPPQLTGPPSPASPTGQSAQTPAAAQTPRPHPVSDYTLGVMGEVKPVTTEELLDDSLNDMPWDADPQQR